LTKLARLLKTHHVYKLIFQTDVTLLIFKKCICNFLNCRLSCFENFLLATNHHKEPTELNKLPKGLNNSFFVFCWIIPKLEKVVDIDYLVVR
jgi:hypothetical protein